jgi:hypothetical protein
MKPTEEHAGPDALGVSSASVGRDGIEVKASENSFRVYQLIVPRCYSRRLDPLLSAPITNL